MKMNPLVNKFHCLWIYLTMIFGRGNLYILISLYVTQTTLLSAPLSQDFKTQDLSICTGLDMSTHITVVGFCLFVCCCCCCCFKYFQTFSEAFCTLEYILYVTPEFSVLTWRAPGNFCRGDMRNFIFYLLFEVLNLKIMVLEVKYNT